MSEFAIQEFISWEPLRALREEWNGLVKQLGLGPAQEFEWLETVWEVNKLNRELLVLVLRDPQGIAGIAPFVKESEKRNGIRVGILRSLGWLHAVHGTQMILGRNPENLLSAILDHLQQNHGEWALWFTQYVCGEGQAELLKKELAERGFFHEFHTDARSPYMVLGETWDEKMKSLQPRFRTSLRSREKRMREKGALELRFLDGPGTWESGLAAIREIEEDSWKIAAGTAITVQDFQWQFYSRYAPVAVAKGTLRIPVLFLDNEPVAYDYALFDGGIYYLLKTSYKQKWQELYPGVVLRKLLVEWAYAQRAREIDFLGKDEEWKMKWTSSIREHSNFFVYNRNWSALYLLGLHRLKTVLKRKG